MDALVELIELEAFILVGGKSSRLGRLGQHKALLQIDGVTLAERAANTISTALSPKEIYLVARDENQFAAGGLPENLPVIYDQFKERGAYSGLHAALDAAKTEWVFVLACDYPLISVDLLKFLLKYLAEMIPELMEGTFDAIVPVQPDGIVQPLCAFYRAGACLSVVEEILRSDEKLPPLRTVFEKVRTRVVTFEEIDHLPGADNFFLNLNTPEDLEAVAPASRRLS
ncbi:MAG TPA: molybdenum cofactor guanylyltransferase [Pyrinomonadaceae bacterium]|jgi:molybdopterin-guanine dinucleotide biosynthesis protein A|nr:molybdenum cofactor guanylyltransferase [Pyrinomonadaceae bacterium]